MAAIVADAARRIAAPGLLVLLLIMLILLAVLVVAVLFASLGF